MPGPPVPFSRDCLTASQVESPEADDLHDHSEHRTPPSCMHRFAFRRFHPMKCPCRRIGTIGTSGRLLQALLQEFAHSTRSAASLAVLGDARQQTNAGVPATRCRVYGAGNP